MSVPRDVGEYAHAWTLDLVDRVLQPLRERNYAQLLSIEWIAGCVHPRLAAAAQLMQMVSDYTLGRTPDEIRHKLLAAASDEPLAEATAGSLVRISVLFVRSGAALPDPRWWSPMWHADHLSTALARAELAAGRDAADHLGRRLWWPEAAVEEILRTARHGAGIDYSAIGSVGAECEQRLTALVADADFGTSVCDAAVRLGETGGGRLDLIRAAAQRDQLYEMRRRAEQISAADLVETIDHEGERLIEASRGLSALELELLRPVDEDEELLMRTANLGKRFIGMTETEGPAPLPDLIDGVREVPRELALHLRLGMHGYQQRSGPIAQWSVLVEGPVPQSLSDESGQVGIGLRPEPGEDVRFVVRSFLDGEAIDAPITYPAGAISTVALALLYLIGQVRIDFFVRDRRRYFRHQRQIVIPIGEELLAELRPRAVAAARNLFAHGDEAAERTLQAEHEPPVEIQAAAGLLHCEWGKSEQLLEVSLPEYALGPTYRVPAEQAQTLRAARHRLLQAEATRIDEQSEASEQLAASAEADYLRLVQTMRGEQSHRSQLDQALALQTLTDGVATDRQAVVHLALTSGGLDCLWADRADGTLHTDLTTLGDIDLDALEGALETPEIGTVGRLDDEEGPGVQLGAALFAHVQARGVGALVICSTQWLHRLPVHALLVGLGPRRLIDVVDVSYAPSAGVLQQLAATPPRSGPTVVAAVDLHHARDEAAVVAALAPESQLLPVDAVTPAALVDAWRTASRVHVCSHGHYEATDSLASRLELSEENGRSGRLTVARILADADVHGTDLAVLGACFSGAGETAGSALDIAGGIDSALIAAGVRNVVSALWEIDDLAALLFHGQVYLSLSEGGSLFDAYRSGLELLRSGQWRHVAALPLGGVLARCGVNVAEALDRLEEDGHSDDFDDPIDFSDLSYWAPFRVCGLGILA